MFLLPEFYYAGTGSGYKLVVILICNVLLNTLWLSMLYGQAFAVLLPARLMKNLIMWPVDSMIFYTIAKTFETAGIFRMIRGRVAVRKPP